MKYEELIGETLEQLENLEKKQKLVRDEKRIQFLRILKSGEASTQAAAGQIVGWKLRQAQKIWGLYRKAGLAGVLEKTEKRGFGKLTGFQISQLNRYLEQFGAGTLEEIQQYLAASFGVRYTIGGLSDLCLRLKIKLKTARPTNYKKDETEVAAYKKTLAV